MEKRRRARINHSLSVLKSLIIKDEVGLLNFLLILNNSNLLKESLYIYLFDWKRPTVRTPLHNHDLKRRTFWN